MKNVMSEKNVISFSETSTLAVVAVASATGGIIVTVVIILLCLKRYVSIMRFMLMIKIFCLTSNVFENIR